MSNRKPLNKYNKAELYQLAKDNKDEIKALKLVSNLHEESYSKLELAYSELITKLRDTNEQFNEAKLIIKSRIPSMKIDGGKKKNKKNRNFRNLFGLLS